MKKVLFVLFLVFLGLSFTGCGTIFSQYKSREVFAKPDKYGKYNRDDDCNPPTPHIYSGVVSDIQMLTFPVSCKCSGESGLGFIVIWPIFIPLSIIDIPLSFVADTVILPYSIFRQVKYGNITEACKY